jgi:integrase
LHVDIRLRLANCVLHRERKRLTTASKSAALRWGQERERHLLQHGPPQPKKEVPTLTEFWHRFMEGHVRANRQKPSGVEAKEMIGRVHLLPRFGAIRLDEISTERVQQLKSGLTGRAPKTVNNVLTVLNTLLKKAVEWKVIERMPCTVRLLPVPLPPPRFHDFEDYERLVKAARNRSREAYLIVLLGGEAGLRRGEIAALQWADVDFKKRQVSVQRSVWKGHVGTPKGGRSRYVPLTGRLVAALQSVQHPRGPWVFSDQAGTAVGEKAIGDHVDHSARAAELKHRGIHILRHTFCSHLAMRGAPARAIQVFAGHANLRTTERYMPLSPAALDGAIRLLELRPIGNIVATAESGVVN